MKQTPMKRVSKKRYLAIREEREMKRLLCEEAGGRYEPGNNACVGIVCPKCKLKPDFRGLDLIHKIPKGRGGTNRANCELGCQRCHNTEYHGIREVDSKPIWSKEV